MRFPLERNYEFSAIPTGGTVDQRYYMITRSTNRWPSIRSQSFVSNRLTSRKLRAPWRYVPEGLVFEGAGGAKQKLHESRPCILGSHERIRIRFNSRSSSFSRINFQRKTFINEKITKKR